MVERRRPDLGVGELLSVAAAGGVVRCDGLEDVVLKTEVESGIACMGES